MAMANAYPQVEFSDITDLEEIGRGAFGIVYKAIWQDKVIAVKDFFPKDENAQKKVEKELTQSFRIGEHSNIIDIYGVSIKNGHTYLLMEYAYGGSLQRVLFGSAKEEYTTKRAISWMYQCAKGVAFLHASKLLHRDLKPDNLLLTDWSYKTLKICDFGTVSELKTTMTENTGTLALMAPEVFDNRKYTEKCDVYSFAITLWEVFAREEYFRTFNCKWGIPDKVRKGHRPELKDVIPDQIQTLMTSCWEKDPSKRPYMEDVVVEMESLLKTYSSNGARPPNEKYEQDLTDNFLGLRVCDVMGEIGLAVASDRAEGNEIISSSSTSQDYPFKIKIPPEIRMASLIGDIKEILVLEHLTSLNSIKKEAFDKGWFGITYKAHVEVDDDTKMLALKGFDINGWFGIIYKAEVDKMKMLALKVYNRKYSNMHDKLFFYYSRRPNYRQENVLDLYFMFIYKSKIYYGLEYVEGGSLYKMLHFESKSYSKNNALNWLRYLARVLRNFHNNYICMNMLTSRNIFIDRSGKLIIGLPIEEEEANFFKTTYKSAAWMAPEVHEDGKYSKTSDIYSLGIIIWEVFNRRIPFDGCAPDEIAEMVKGGIRPPIKEDEDESIKKLLRSCWERDPRSRPTMDSVHSTLWEFDQNTLRTGWPFGHMLYR